MGRKRVVATRNQLIFRGELVGAVSLCARFPRVQSSGKVCQRLAPKLLLHDWLQSALEIRPRSRLHV